MLPFPEFPTTVFELGTYLYKMGTFLRKHRVEHLWLVPYEFLMHFNVEWQRMGIRMHLWSHRNQPCIRVKYLKINEKRQRPIFKRDCQRALAHHMRGIVRTPGDPCWYCLPTLDLQWIFKRHGIEYDSMGVLKRDQDCFKLERLFSMQGMTLSNELYHLTGHEDVLLLLGCCHLEDAPPNPWQNLPNELFHYLIMTIVRERFYEAIGFRMHDHAQ